MAYRSARKNSAESVRSIALGHKSISHRTLYDNDNPSFETTVVPSHFRLDDESTTKKAELARRLTIGTAEALGISNDLETLKMMQRVRAHSFESRTQETREVDNLVELLREATADEEEDPVGLAMGKMTNREIGAFNQAFMRDMELLEQDANNQLPEFFSYQNLDGTDIHHPYIDQETLNFYQQSSAMVSPNQNIFLSEPSMKYFRDLKVTEPSTKDPLPPYGSLTKGVEDAEGGRYAASISQFEEIAEVDAEGLLAEVQQEYKQYTTRGGKDKGVDRSSSRRATVYDNFYSDVQMSPAKLNINRFKSSTQLAKPKSSKKVKSKQMSLWGDSKSRLVSDERYDIHLTKEVTRSSKEINTVYADDTESKDVEVINKAAFNLENIKITHRSLTPGEKKGFLHGRAALEHYLKYAEIEKKILTENLNEQKFFIKMRLREKKGRIEEALQLAKEHYCSEHGITSKLQRRMTKPTVQPLTKAKSSATNPSVEGARHEPFKITAGIRLQLESLKTYIPWFIVTITLLQIVGVIVLAGLGGVAPVSLVAKTGEEEFQVWGGKELIKYEIPINLWVGPSEQMLVQLGALFSPCLREDKLMALRVAKYKLWEREGLGCCEVFGSGAGTTTESECRRIVSDYHVAVSNWTNITCNNRVTKTLTRGFETHLFKPCCYGIMGHCRLTTHEHCKAGLDGIWHSDVRESCSQVHCSTDICETVHLHSGIEQESSHLAGYSDTPDSLEVHSHSQFWRLLVSLFYHYGFIHLIMVATIQCIMGLEVEKVTGWLRVAAIYIVSGYSGLLIGSIAKPYEVNVGAQGAAFGLLGMNLVELLQAWKLVDKPLKSLLKLSVITALGLSTGFLPQINWFTQLGGFIFGVMMSIICLPYVTFNYWHARTRLVLIVIFSFLVVSSLSVLSFIFYKSQPPGIGPRNSVKCIMENIC